MEDVTTPEPLTLYTADRVRIDAGHLRGGGDVCFVLAHGFTCSWRQPALRRIAAALNAHGGVLALDFRGHGRSGGHTTVGDREVLDVDAAVAAARRRGYEHIVVTGFSMGGAIVVRHAALHGGVDAVVSVSAPARWYYRGRNRCGAPTGWSNAAWGDSRSASPAAPASPPRAGTRSQKPRTNSPTA